MNTNKRMGSKIGLFVLLLLLIGIPLSYGQKDDGKLIAKVSSTKLVVKGDTVRDFSATILNENAFNSEFYKNGNLFQDEIVINVSSKLIIRYKDYNYMIDEFRSYFEKPKMISVVFVVKDVSYGCVDIEYTKNGQKLVSQISTPHGDDVHYCNYCILKEKK